MTPLNVGIIGCGAISHAYLDTAKKFPMIKVAACADLNPAAAQARAEQFGIAKVCTVEQMLADPAIDIILNLTIPKAHAPLALRALNAGKHVYSEKPLGITREEGRELIDVAKRKNLRIGNAPDTFFGAGIQTARKLIDDGAIGHIVGGHAFMLGRGHESWHPNPEFYYEPGGGPMFDMGPYYLTALLYMLGPIQKVIGATRIALPVRTITHGDGKGGKGPKHGKPIYVETPDHLAGIMHFANGAIFTITTSFAVTHGNYNWSQPITIYGTQGTLMVPDPNGFDGEVKLHRHGEGEPVVVPHQHCLGYQRMVGVADMACAIRSGREHRANGDLAFAVLDVMQGFLDSSASGQPRVMEAFYKRPAALPVGLTMGVLD